MYPAVSTSYGGNISSNDQNNIIVSSSTFSNEDWENYTSLSEDIAHSKGEARRLHSRRCAFKRVEIFENIIKHQRSYVTEQKNSEDVREFGNTFGYTKFFDTNLSFEPSVKQTSNLNKSIEAIMKYFGDDVELDICSNSSSSMEDVKITEPADNLSSTVNFKSQKSEPEIDAIIEQSEPIVEESRYVLKQSRPIVKQSRPTVAELRLIFEQTYPAIKQTRPFLKQSRSIIEQPLPTLTDTRLTVEQLRRKFEHFCMPDVKSAHIPELKEVSASAVVKSSSSLMVIKPIPKPRTIIPYNSNDISTTVTPSMHNGSNFAEDTLWKYSVKDKVLLYNKLIANMSKALPQPIEVKVSNEETSYERKVEKRCTVDAKQMAKEWEANTNLQKYSTPKLRLAPISNANSIVVSEHQNLYTETNTNRKTMRHASPSPTPNLTEPRYTSVAERVRAIDDSVLVQWKKQLKDDTAVEQYLTTIASTSRKIKGRAPQPPTPNFIEPECASIDVHNLSRKIKICVSPPPTPVVTEPEYTSVAQKVCAIDGSVVANQCKIPEPSSSRPFLPLKSNSNSKTIKQLKDATADHSNLDTIDNTSKKIKRRAPQPPTPPQPASVAEAIPPPTANFTELDYTLIGAKNSSQTIKSHVPSPHIPNIAKLEYASVAVTRHSPLRVASSPNFLTYKSKVKELAQKFNSQMEHVLSTGKNKRPKQKHFNLAFNRMMPPIPAKCAHCLESPENSDPISMKSVPATLIAEPEYTSIAEWVHAIDDSVAVKQFDKQPKDVTADHSNLDTMYSTIKKIKRRAPQPPTPPELDFVSIGEMIPAPNFPEPEYDLIDMENLSQKFQEPEYSSVTVGNLSRTIMKPPSPPTLNITEPYYAAVAVNNSSLKIQRHAPPPPTPNLRKPEFSERVFAIDSAAVVNQCNNTSPSSNAVTVTINFSFNTKTAEQPINATTTSTAAATTNPHKRQFKRLLPRKKREERYEAESHKAAKAKRNSEVISSWLPMNYLAPPKKKHCPEILPPGMIFGSTYMKRLFFAWLKESDGVYFDIATIHEQDETILFTVTEHQMEPCEKLIDEALPKLTKVEAAEENKVAEEKKAVEERKADTAATAIMNDTIIIEERYTDESITGPFDFGVVEFMEAADIKAIKPKCKVKRQAPPPPTLAIAKKLSDFNSESEPEIQKIMDVDESVMTEIMERPRAPTPTQALRSSSITPASMCYALNSAHSTESSHLNITAVKREVQIPFRETSSFTEEQSTSTVTIGKLNEKENQLLTQPQQIQPNKANKVQLQQRQPQPPKLQQSHLQQPPLKQTEPQQLLTGSPLSIDQGFETGSIEIEDSPMRLVGQFAPMTTPSPCYNTLTKEAFPLTELTPHARRAVRRCLALNFANKITSTPQKEDNFSSPSAIRKAPPTPFSPIHPSVFSGRRFMIAFTTRRNTL